MCPQERYPDGSEKGESEPSSSAESGVYRFPKSNVSEIEALHLDPNYDGQGKSKLQETEDSMAMLAIVMAFGALFIVGVVLVIVLAIYG